MGWALEVFGGVSANMIKHDGAWKKAMSASMLDVTGIVSHTGRGVAWRFNI
jgi:hypothetical protein